MHLSRRRDLPLALALLGALCVAAAVARMVAAAPSDVDPSFGGGEQVATDLGGTDAAYTIAVQPDGKLLLAGTSDAGGEKFSLALVRYNPDGTLDEGFGAAGIVTTDLGGTDAAYAVGVGADGAIVVLAVSDVGARRDRVLLRYSADGRLDEGFGSGGIIRTPLAPDFPITAGLAVRPDGKIVVGEHQPSPRGYDLVLTRYQPDGGVDRDFGVDGALTLDFAGAEGALALHLAGDGGIVVAGSTGAPGAVNIALERLSADGGGDRVSLLGQPLAAALGDHVATALSISESGEVTLAAYFVDGETHTLLLQTPPSPAGGASDAAAGRVDATVTRTLEQPYALGLQPDAKVLVAGLAQDDFAVRRYLGASTGPTPSPSTTATPRAMATPPTRSPARRPLPAPPARTAPQPGPAMPMATPAPALAPAPTAPGAPVAPAASAPPQPVTAPSSAPAPAPPSAPPAAPAQGSPPPTGGAPPSGPVLPPLVSPPLPAPSSAPVPLPSAGPVPVPSAAPLPAPSTAPLPVPNPAPLPLPLPAPDPLPMPAPLPPLPGALPLAAQATTTGGRSRASRRR